MRDFWNQSGLIGAQNFGEYIIEDLEKQDAGKERSRNKTAISRIKQHLTTLELEAFSKGHEIKTVIIKKFSIQRDVICIVGGMALMNVIVWALGG